MESKRVIKLEGRNLNIDKEVLLIATLLHDVAMTNPKYGIKDHAENGVILAQKILNKYSYPQDKIDFVKKQCQRITESTTNYSTSIDRFGFKGCW